MASAKSNPSCPACGSSATLPFEMEANGENEQRFSEIVLTILLLFLALFAILLVFLLSRAGLPMGVLICLTVYLFWRYKKKRGRIPRRSGAYICLDCSRNFRA